MYLKDRAACSLVEAAAKLLGSDEIDRICAIASALNQPYLKQEKQIIILEANKMNVVIGIS